jgi:hypothetical protein
VPTATHAVAEKHDTAVRVAEPAPVGSASTVGVQVPPASVSMNGSLFVPDDWVCTQPTATQLPAPEQLTAVREAVGGPVGSIPVVVIQVDPERARARALEPPILVYKPVAAHVVASVQSTDRACAPVAPDGSAGVDAVAVQVVPAKVAANMCDKLPVPL